MAHRLSAYLLVTMLAGAVGAEEDAARLQDHPEVQGALAVVDAWVDAVQAYEKIPGISLGLVVDQNLLFEKGYGYANLRRQVAADADTIYSICSISKLFTSIGVMQQRDAGRLSLRDPVAQHLPWFDIDETYAEAGPARVEALLTHSSGLPREVDFPYWVERNFPFPDRAAMIEQIKQQQTLYPADTLFQYSNLGLTLAGEIVSAVSGRGYAEYIAAEILEPLEMADTRPHFPEKLRGKEMAIGYAGRGRDGRRPPVPAFDTRAIAPAAGFTSTVNDLAKFAQWQFRVLGQGDDAGVLDANTLREMHRVHWVDEDWKASWGLGFVVGNAEGSTMVGHGGGCPGYITSFLMVPKHKIAVIALTNAGDGPAYEIATNVLRTVGPALRKAGQAKAGEASAELSAETDNLEPYAGNYGGTIWGGETAVRVWGDKLAVLALPQDEIDDVAKLKRVDGDTFVRLTEAGDERETWVFQRDETGAVSGFLRHSQIVKRL